MKNLLLPIATLVIALSSSASASTYNWALATGPSQAIGNTTSIVGNPGNLSLVFSGYVTNSSDIPGSNPNTWLAPTAKSTALYSKNAGGDEIGLGIAVDPTGDGEIFKNSFIQIDLNTLLTQKQITSLQLVIGSVQPGEGFFVWGSNTAGQPGALLYTGTSINDDVPFDIPSYGTYRYVSVSASAKNVLLDSVSGATSATPEPGTLSLFFVAGLGLIVVGRKRYAASKAGAVLSRRSI